MECFEFGDHSFDGPDRDDLRAVRNEELGKFSGACTEVNHHALSRNFKPLDEIFDCFLGIFRPTTFISIPGDLKPFRGLLVDCLLHESEIALNVLTDNVPKLNGRTDIAPMTSNTRATSALSKA